ncbi:hypothetical protein C8F04DRAFT_1178313 [Mycena alexandri]|uniref:Uncharacterized protein n=1 Tax=Mycena alexandri TaxID=1745969 RepID=A0AAD6T5S0_9AGAR|nr:hypothetical protein C8F04DRAFT_1178313 [Mycena alexandri]
MWTCFSIDKGNIQDSIRSTDDTKLKKIFETADKALSGVSHLNPGHLSKFSPHHQHGRRAASQRSAFTWPELDGLYLDVSVDNVPSLCPFIPLYCILAVDGTIATEDFEGEVLPDEDRLCEGVHYFVRRGEEGLGFLRPKPKPAQAQAKPKPGLKPGPETGRGKDTINLRTMQFTIEVSANTHESYLLELTATFLAKLPKLEDTCIIFFWTLNHLVNLNSGGGVFKPGPRPWAWA